MPRQSNRAGVRLIHVAHYGGPYRGSFVPMLLAVLGGAQERGWETEALFSPVATARPWLSEFERQGVPTGFLDTRPLAATASQLRQRLDADPGRTLIHTHFTDFDIAAAWAVRRAPRARLVWHLHEFLPSRPRARIRRYAKFLVARPELDAALCVGSDSVDDLRRARVIRRDRVRHMPNAVDLDAFPLVDASSRRAAKERLGLAPDVPVLLHFGRDWHLKGGDLFVRALASLKRDGVQAVGLTVWAGEEGRRDAARCGVEDIIRFQPDTDVVQHLYSAADILVSCSRHEADPSASFAILEGLGSGLGVVVAAPDRPDSPNVPTRRFVTLDPERIAAGIRDLLGRSDVVAGEEARVTRSWAEQTIGLPAYAERTLEIYEQLLAGRRPIA